MNQKPVKPIKEAEIIEEPNGWFRVRLVTNFATGEFETSEPISPEELANARFLTDEEAWKIFDDAARAHLKMSGKQFLKKWDNGDYPDPDAEEGVMSVVMLLPMVRPLVQEE